MFRAVTSVGTRWKALVDGSLHIPANEHFGFRVKEAEDPWTKIALSWKVTREYCNWAGNVQGGVLAVFADAVLGAASAVYLPVEQYPALVEMKLSIFRPAPEGSELIGEGYVLKAGKRVIFAEAEIKDSEGRLIAKASGTEIPTEP